MARGANDKQGASTTGGGMAETAPVDDACPSTTGIIGMCAGIHPGTGGDGGPGVVQLHTPTGTIAGNGDITLPPGGAVNLEDILFPAPVGTDFDPVNQVSPTQSFLVPQFGQFSRARSVWVPLGEGGFQGVGPNVSPTFEFGGTLGTGLIEVAGSTVVPPNELIPGGTTLSNVPGVTPYIAADEFTLVVDAATVAQKFSENPNLLVGYLIDLEDAAMPTTFSRFEVEQASYDSGTDTLSLMTSMSGPKLTSFSAPTIDVLLRPAFFRVDTNGAKDFLPTTSTVTILFDAAPLDPNTGGPDETQSYATVVNGDPNLFEPDIANINAQGADYRFIRFEVVFDIGTNAMGQVDPSLPRPTIDFLRVPFSY